MGLVTIYGSGYNFRDLIFPDTKNNHSRFDDAHFDNCCFERNFFKNCDFSNAYVKNTSYKEAVFEDGTYQDAFFAGCDFSNVFFRDCIFKCSFFTLCKFTQANFKNCMFIECDFSSCYLGYRGTPTFCGGDIKDCSYMPYIPMSCPETGPIIGYKKATVFDDSGSHRGWIDVIVKLEIPEDAKRSSALGRKCRCDKAKVLGIYDIKQYLEPIGVREDGVVDAVTRKHIGNKMSDETVAYSKFHFRPLTGTDPFTYKVDQWVYPDEWDDNRFDECSHGIHFFINAQEAVDY